MTGSLQGLIFDRFKEHDPDLLEDEIFQDESIDYFNRLEDRMNNANVGEDCFLEQNIEITDGKVHIKTHVFSKDNVIHDGFTYERPPCETSAPESEEGILIKRREWEC